MIDIVLFYLFSLFEYLAIFTLMFSLFRFELKEYLTEMVVLSFIMTFFSHYLRAFLQINDFAPIVLLLVLVVLFWVIGRIPIFYASVMVVTSYLMYGVFQYTTFMILSTFIVLSLEEIRLNSEAGYLLQITTIIPTLLVSFGLRRMNLGFGFIPTGFVRIKFRGYNLALLITVCISVVLFGFFNYWIFARGKFALISLIFLGILGVLLYLSKERDIKND
ncbi:hypothetical protein [Brevibacillus laterosporus]|uniref:Uncharacterized protein n=1 Tax=Brevibacillus laterosporus TaxID=1465 RepID=A0AAP3GCY0_BRELA|nr:hypothetical protein [Brevibacillus laterosporus]MCR8983326.1 hypothetical protein [Brevibacillus laterosporus]MCZ0810482.1 hypothetical protein [Brevibacillus laterosporus]MCZ0829055.1 hypothetical protein [Brevibacillus laterosporus]MCZ0853189.1 hypothetical protein [Brevibacillus laterosporus]